jgi:hypothetical protein
MSASTSSVRIRALARICALSLSKGTSPRLDELTAHLQLADDVGHCGVVRAHKIVDLDECAVAVRTGAECGTAPA